MKINLLEKILEIPSKSNNETSMRNFILDFLKQHKINYIISKKNIIATKQTEDFKGYLPSVCCHIDTVHEIVINPIPIEKFPYKNSWIYTSKYGIGGDDKCGIFICLSLLETCKNLKVFFFSNEEIGMQGSLSLDERYFNNIAYLVEIDRKGNSDLIRYHYGISLISEDFKTFISDIQDKYKYIDTEGIGTDVSSLAETGLNLSVINLSCGYYKPHSKEEYIVLKDIEHCYQFTKEIIDNSTGEKYPNEYIEDYPNYLYQNTYKDIYFEGCVLCGETSSEGYNSETGFICNTCLDTIIDNYLNN